MLNKMMCYRDMTFCPYFKECKEGGLCSRALTDEVKENAKKWWGKEGAPICRFIEKPECFKEK